MKPERLPPQIKEILKNEINNKAVVERDLFIENKINVLKDKYKSVIKKSLAKNQNKIKLESKKMLTASTE